MITSKWPILAGLFVLALGAGARFSIGTIYSNAKAVDLIASLSSAGLYLGSTIATASATTLALMLTLLGVTRRSDSEIDNSVYQSISQVAIFATSALVVSVILLLILVMPIGEFENLPSIWFPTLYNIIFGLVVFVSGLLVTTILQLFLTIRHVIATVTPGDEV